MKDVLEELKERMSEEHRDALDEFTSIDRTTGRWSRHFGGIDASVRGHELMALFNLATQQTTGCIVEIGSWRGASTAALALGTICSKKCLPVYAIDPHDAKETYPPDHDIWKRPDGLRMMTPNNRTRFLEGIIRLGTGRIIRPIALKTQDMTWSKEICLLFIDGDHSYEVVKHDFEKFEPHVIMGGYVAMHDTGCFPGPKKLLAEKMKANRFGKVDAYSLPNMAVLRKTSLQTIKK